MLCLPPKKYLKGGRIMNNEREKQTNDCEYFRDVNKTIFRATINGFLCLSKSLFKTLITAYFLILFISALACVWFSNCGPDSAWGPEDCGGAVLPIFPNFLSMHQGLTYLAISGGGLFVMALIHYGDFRGFIVKYFNGMLQCLSKKFGQFMFPGPK